MSIKYFGLCDKSASIIMINSPFEIPKASLYAEPIPYLLSLKITFFLNYNFAWILSL